MNLTRTDCMRLLLDAEITISDYGDGSPVDDPHASDSVTVFGRVSQARTGGSLPGLRVLALASAGSYRDAPIGSATSGADGRFRIEFDDRPDLRERLLEMRHRPDSRLRLRVETDDGHALFTSHPIALDRAEVEVSLAVPISGDPVAAGTWALLGRHLLQTRIGHLNGVVRLLSEGGAIGASTRASADIPMLTRQSMLDQLEQAFLDPTGILRKAAGRVPSLQQLHDPDHALAYARELQKHDENEHVAPAFSAMLDKARSFGSLAEVDWLIDPSLLEQGNVGGALDGFSKNYVSVDLNATPRHVETTHTLYRDYLLAIWTGLAPQIATAADAHLTAAQAIAQLTARFHQNFATFDEKQRPANSVLIPILTAILTSPTGKGFGFNVSAATITPQGTRTPREYLDFLIGLSHLSATELGRRYRLDLARPDSEPSDPVQENVATLQGFFRDSFQCDLEPDHVDPDILDQPIIPDKSAGNAPFFLYFDEWLRQQAPFYPENYLDIRRVLPVDVNQRGRFVLGELIMGKGLGNPLDKPLYVKQWKFCQDILAVWDSLQAGHVRFYAGEYELALIQYRAASDLATAAMKANLLQALAMGSIFNQRKNRPLNGIVDVAPFMDSNRITEGAFGYDLTPDRFALNEMALRLAYYALFTIPVCLGDAEYAAGDFDNAVFHYGQATRFKVGVALESDLAGGSLYSHGDKPFTVLLYGSDAPDNAQYPVQRSAAFGTAPDDVDDYAVKWNRRIPHLAEIRLCRLRQAAAMLEWADALYRSNDPTSMARARELYKGVLWLHGKVPPICPTWPPRFLGGFGSGTVLHPGGVPATYAHHDENPALVSQTTRAYRGIYQIDNHLNYYGEHDDIVPMIRYRPLKNAADRAAAMARGAQQDFLQYTERVETAIRSRMQLANFMQKAKLQSAIATEQKAIADHDVVVAQDQVAAVEAAIKAKQDEITKHDSLFGQIGDAFKTVKSIYEDVPDNTKSSVGAPIEAGADNIGKAETKEMAGKGMLGLGEAGSVMTGFGMFAVVGYVTLTGLQDAANQRTADLHTLEEKALPAARAAVEARQHGVAITRYQQQIAQADVDLAELLLAFDEHQLLNQNFWLQLAQIARRLLRRYLEMGARIGWLAERALVYEQDRAIRFMRMDYFPVRLQGVTGADLMQADLAELDATRIEGMRRTVPVRRTLSLAREFPLAYGQLKTTGRCTFRTEEAFFRRAYPGTSAYRVRAISTAVQQAEFTQPLRGSLINRGVSISKPQRIGEHVLVRPAESLPLSEFRLEQDMAVFGLPNDTLLTFEGSNIETFWELGFPKAANATGLDGLVDVLLTFDLFCEFAPELYEGDLVAMPSTERKWILISAARYQGAAITRLAGAAATVDVVFDLASLKLLPRQEMSRKIKNVAAFVVTSDKIDFTAKLSATTPATSASVSFKEGFAMSSLHPDPGLPPLPVSPLNAFADMNPEQLFTLAISKPANPGVDFQRVTDVVLALEYEASLV